MRILAIDYGSKRTGIAVTDPFKIIASGLTTVPTAELFSFLKKYFSEEKVERVVVGEPMHLDGNPSQIAPEIELFIKKMNENWPEMPIDREDERHTSNEAKALILQSGLRKKDRRDKARVDKIAAALILENYMNRTFWKSA